jgi:HEAT repeat protein/beta-lactamase regulating signal transducer with metallopeptidase domain
MSAVLLIQIAAKASIVLALAWGITMTMRRGSAAGRHLVWAVALAATLALPLVRAIVPAWTVTVSESAWSSTAAAPAVDRAPMPAPEQQEVALPSQGAMSDAPVPAVSPAIAPSAGTPLMARLDLAAMALLVWLLGVAVLVSRLVFGLVRAGRIAQHATPVTDDEWLQTFDAAAALLRVDRRVDLRQTTASSVPVACGLWRPSILLPADALTWSQERRLVVLLHELAHVRRRDCLVQAMAQFTAALHWVNPLAHVALRRLRAEQERACDDLVLAAGTDAPAYADHLFEIARSFRSPAAPAWATLAMARPSQLEGRLMAILDHRCNRAPLAARARLACAASATAMLIALGALHLTAATPEPAPVDATATASSSGSIGRESSAATSATTNGRTVTTRREQRREEPVRFSSLDAQASPAPAAAPQAAPAPQAAGQSSAVTDETRRRVADALATALNDENQDVREQALNGLASMGDARAIPALLRGMRDPSADLRERAISGLAQFDTPEALDGIVGALKDASPQVRQHAIRLVGSKMARGRIDSAKYVSTFIDLLRDATPDIREAAARALGDARATQAVPALTPLLKDPQRDVRQQAALALGQIADPAAIDPLTAALKDADAQVRERAAMALAQIARGQRRGPRGLPIPPVPPTPPGRPLVSVDIDPAEIAELTREAIEKGTRGLEQGLAEFERSARDLDKLDLKLDKLKIK